MKEDSKRTINGVRTKKQVYTESKSLFAFNQPKKIKVRNQKKSKEISVLKEEGRKHKQVYTCEKMRKNEEPKKKRPKSKRKIKKAQTIPDTRLTEPKKRSLLRRVMLQMKYNRGAFDHIEEDYDDLTREELEGYRESNKRIDRKYYKQVQEYEDAYDDVTVKRGWMAFKIGLATILLCTSIGLSHHVVQEIYDNAPQPTVIVTLQDASEEQISNAKAEMNSVKTETGYNFNYLTPDEQLDATLRFPIVESKIPEGRFKNAIFGFTDQELLEDIVVEAFGAEDYGSYSDGKKSDLKKLAYELLDESQKEWVRDPQMLAELMAQREAERIEREKNQAEVEARLNRTEHRTDDEMELE